MNSAKLPSELTCRTIELMSQAHYAILQGSMSVNRQVETGDGYAASVTCLDRAILHLSRGKWLYGRATGDLADFAVRSFSVTDLESACNSFTEVIRIVGQIGHDSSSVLADEDDAVTHKNELVWFHDTPIVPNICPLIILAGSSVDMGRQYVSQCVEVFGDFIFEAFAGKSFSRADREHLSLWENNIRKFTPEVLDMVSGIVDGANQQGIDLNRDQALSMWVGTLQPAKKPASIGVLDAEGGGVVGAYFGNAETTSEDVVEGLCSGAAAWGEATKDGHLYFSTSTDHDCTFQATIIAYPDEGYPFIYTPFSVNGSVPGVGRFGMAGHPGFNTKGLAYIHHGGGGACAENVADWGYGIPRGASTFHILRYAESAQQAESLEREFPVGDVGHVLGSPGGFYADDQHGFVYESRDHQYPVIRYETQDASGRPYQFLYATNNVISREVSSPVFPAIEQSMWDPVKGWVNEQDDAGDIGLLTRRLWSVSAASRNQYLYTSLTAQNGNIDLMEMLSVFQRGPNTGSLSWCEAETHMNSGGELAGHSAAHRLNAFVAAGAPAERKYLAAIGPITHRSVSPNRPGHGYFIYDETNAYWEVTLADNILETLAVAKDVAKNLACKAESALAQVQLSENTRQRLEGFNSEIRSLLKSEIPTSIDGHRMDEALAVASKCLRHYTRAQVRARQILQAISPPAEWGVGGIQKN